MVERKTSVAKDALEASADRLLERYGVVTGEFDKAREDDPSIVHENAHLRDGKDDVQIEANVVNVSERTDRSDMVANDQPKLDNKPPPEIARPVDRESFNDRLEQEHKAHDYERGDDYER